MATSVVICTTNDDFIIYRMQIIVLIAMILSKGLSSRVI